MEKKQWTMQEDFIFPVETGVPAGVELLQVIPRYTEERTAEAVRLTGVYHIAANVVFDEGQRAEDFSDSAILIDDVDVQGEAGYFEYAVPLHIDLPSEVGSPLQVVTTAAINESDGQGVFSVVWDVECSYEKAVAQVEEPAMTASTEELKEVVEADDLSITIEADKSGITEAEDALVVDSPTATQAGTPFHEADEALAFIAGLEDGVSITSFRSNDVFVKNES
ncbi:hypothetical protein [Sporosarcina beigongshangi]|uniref:hypothetical protein n=1 Tax=Sporosarcina beigongshangi TaxID=2782538 RepID=UPI001939EEE4|nr:hypothetical protein [Sporosarcina beigongshangi]